MKDLSGVLPVREMAAGKSGDAEFHSPALNIDMIAGYTTVKGSGWGVMVPQPLAELRGRADEVRHHALGVFVAGVIAAALVSWLVSGYMSRRLQGVSEAARAMADGGRDMRVQRPAGLDPRELSELSEAFNAMAEQIERSSHQQFEARAGGSGEQSEE